MRLDIFTLLRQVCYKASYLLCSSQKKDMKTSTAIDVHQYKVKSVINNLFKLDEKMKLKWPSKAGDPNNNSVNFTQILIVFYLDHRKHPDLTKVLWKLAGECFTCSETASSSGEPLFIICTTRQSCSSFSAAFCLLFASLASFHVFFSTIYWDHP